MNKSATQKIRSRLDEIESVLDLISGVLEELAADHKTCYKVRLALDEILANVVSYAYGDGEGDITISYIVEDDPRAIEITIIDEGQAFDPLEVKDPDLDVGVKDRKIGGLGLFIVRNTVDELSYRRENNQNILTLKKNL